VIHTIIYTRLLFCNSYLALLIFPDISPTAAATIPSIPTAIINACSCSEILDPLRRISSNAIEVVVIPDHFKTLSFSIVLIKIFLSILVSSSILMPGL
jgi:hypothetical protein